MRLLLAMKSLAKVVVLKQGMSTKIVYGRYGMEPWEKRAYVAIASLEP